MQVWEVFGKRSEDDPLVLVGAVKAPDLGMAVLLARETHFRHKEGVAYAVRLRGDPAMHAGAWEGDALGGVTDRSYRRQDGYVGVGSKLKRVRQELAARGLVIDRPRPSVGRGGRGPQGATRPGRAVT